jgi:hypothetical protein
MSEPIFTGFLFLLTLGFLWLVGWVALSFLSLLMDTIERIRRIAEKLGVEEDEENEEENKQSNQ